MKRGHLNLFGLDFLEEELEVKDLPLYLCAGRSFFRLSRTGQEFILVGLPANERFGVTAFEKQAVQLSERFRMPVAFGFEHVSKAQRDSLIKKDIPFIAGSELLYLPFLGAKLSDRFSNPKKIGMDKMMPVTQTLFLYMLYQGKGRPVMKKEAARAIGATGTSITRASEQLEAMGLISQEKKGKACYMAAQGSGTELFKKAKPYLINPVLKTITVEADGKYKSLPLSGESALAKRTMLNDPAIPVRAVLKSDSRLSDKTGLDIRWTTDINPLKLELWKYDPRLFADNGIADPVSLALSFENSADERIEGAIEEYLEGYIW